MSVRKLDKQEWKSYFEAVARQLGSASAEIEVVGLGLGDQIEAEWVPLAGITYDPKDDVVSIATETVDHLVHNPTAVFVDHNIEGLRSLEIIDHEDNRHIVRLKTPLALSAG